MGPMVTLFQEQSLNLAGAKLASRVVKDCLYCRAQAAKLTQQRMSSYREERIAQYTKPCTVLCLDLLGPTMIKAISNKRANMKQAFSLQYDHFFPLIIPLRR